MGVLLHCEACRIRGWICLDDIIGVRAAFWCALKLCWTDRDALRFVGTVSVKPLQLLARNAKAAKTRRRSIVGILMLRRLFALLRAAAFVMVALVRVGRNEEWRAADVVEIGTKIRVELLLGQRHLTSHLVLKTRYAPEASLA